MGNKRIYYGTPEEEGRKQLDSIVRHRNDLREEAKERYCAQSRERLKKNIETKIRTTMIGSLSCVEQKFGFLWGQGKPRHQLTESELAMEELKDNLRTEILNLGNNQLRAAMSEINQYDVNWQRYHYESSVEDMNEEGLPPAHPIFGLDENGKPKKLRYGTNPDGSIKTSPEG